ncbi:hypothetical protein WA158_005006 [Blastocystis sp. Blastoise]
MPLTILKRNAFFIVDAKYQDMRLDKVLMNKYDATNNYRKEFECSTHVTIGDKIHYPNQLEVKNSSMKVSKQTNEKNKILTKNLESSIKNDSLFYKGQKYPLSTVYEDENILVINKPAGIPSQGGKNQDINIVSIYQYITQNNKLKLLHRLDKSVSGLQILCKSSDPSFYNALYDLFRSNSIKKTYIGCVMNCTMNQHITNIPIYIQGKEGIINTPIIDSHTKKEKSSITNYKVLSSLPPFSLLEIDLKTGRKHQIREHLSSYLSAPVYNDKLYYPSSIPILNNINTLSRLYNLDPKTAFRINTYKGIYLHCSSISFDLLNKHYQFISPLPEPFQLFVNSFIKYDEKNCIPSIYFNKK